MLEKNENNNTERYQSLDGLRAFASLSIVLLHVYLNGNYAIKNSVFNNLIYAFAGFVFLFMMISSFSLCCGYYDKMVGNKISLNSFYTRRYIRIWPFFALLVLIDVILGFNKEAIFEGFADMTLCFGFLPNSKLNVIGVGWTLGVIFVFYIIFPFFCFLLNSKRRAWFVMLAALFFHYTCQTYFFTEKFVTPSFSARANFLYCSIFFLAGGLIYLYKEPIKQLVSKMRVISLLICIILFVIYVVSISDNGSASSIVILLTYSAWLMYAIGTNGAVLCNPFTKFISKISMEIYLSHMIFYRVIEKLHMTHIFQNDLASYIVSFIITTGLAIVFALGFSWVYKKCVSSKTKAIS